MTIYVLCHRVNDDIGAMIQRILNVRAEESVVYYNHDTMSMGNSRHGTDVYETQCGIAGALNPYELGLLGADKLRDVELNAWRERHLYSMGLGDFGEVAMGTAVDV